MIEINLLPEELRRKETVHLNMPQVPVMKILIFGVGGLLLVQALLLLLAVFRNIEIGRLKKDVQALEQQTREVQAQKTRAKTLRAQLGQGQRLTKRDFYWSRLLSELSGSMTKGIWFRDLAIMEGELTLPQSAAPAKGTANARARYLKIEGSAIGPGQETAYIGKFIKQLKENAFLSGVFTQIELTNISQKKIREYDVYDFSLVCVFGDKEATVS